MHFRVYIAVVKAKNVGKRHDWCDQKRKASVEGVFLPEHADLVLPAGEV
jgi:hypothetical protein